MSGLFARLRDLGVFLPFRQQISKWPGYQQTHDFTLNHHLKMIGREFLGYLSETLRSSKDVKDRILRTKKLKNSLSGEVLFLGTGPSLANLTAEQLLYFRSSGGKIASLNGFMYTSIGKKIQPDFYFLGDPQIWDSDSEEDLAFRSDLQKYLLESKHEITLAIPANRTLWFQCQNKIIHWDHRNLAGLKQVGTPDKPWGLSSSVTLIGISFLKFLGYSKIFFAGLDSNMNISYFVNHLNQLVTDHSSHYEYSKASKKFMFNQEYLAPNVKDTLHTPIRNMADLYFAQAIFFRDMYWMFGDNCINVGNDLSNDAASRACLLGGVRGSDGSNG
jgi:hypothetical protein